MIEVRSADHEALALAVERLRSGGLVAFPTETVYGLGADAVNPEAVAGVYRLKQRPLDHPLIVHLPSSEWLWRWGDVEAHRQAGVRPETVEAVARAAWPGPLTLVVRARPSVPRTVTGGQDTVALRVPGNTFALALLGAFGGGVVAPSANRFGRVSPTAASHVESEFADTAVRLLVLDGGTTALGLESTVVDLTSAVPRLLRPGSLPLAVIEAVLGTALERPNERATRTLPRGEHAADPVPRAPGTLARHYAPATPLRVVAAGRLLERSANEAVIARFPAPTVTVGDPAATAHADAAVAPWLELPADAAGFAHGLYAAVRRADGAGAAAILVEEPPDGDEWLAVRDRLARAAAAHDGSGGD